MRCIHRSILAAVLLGVSAASLSAQVVPAPDSTRVATLATVTVTAESGNWFVRADERRRGILDAMAENRRLSSELGRHDARVAELQARLDSLRRVEFVQKIAIAAIDDSVSATRARRRTLEARLIAAEARLPER